MSDRFVSAKRIDLVLDVFVRDLSRFAARVNDKPTTSKKQSASA